MTEAAKLISWLISNNLMRVRYDQVLREEMAELTPFGEEIATILNKLETNSKESQATNELAALKQAEIDKDQGDDVQL